MNNHESQSENLTLTIEEEGVARNYKVEIWEDFITKLPQIVVKAAPIYLPPKQSHDGAARGFWAYGSRPETLAAIGEQLARTYGFHKAILYQCTGNNSWNLYSLERPAQDEQAALTATYLSQVPQAVYQEVRRTHLPKPLETIRKSFDQIYIYALLFLVLAAVVSLNAKLSARGISLLQLVQEDKPLWLIVCGVVVTIILFLASFGLDFWETSLKKKAENAAVAEMEMRQSS